MNQDIDESLNKNTEEQIVTLRIKKSVVELIDKDISKYSSPRSSWITQAVVEKLGYEIY